jgi:undecaprenyl pyrophosphate phosphatase UppP
MRPSPADPSGILGRLPTLITGLLNRVVKNINGPTKEAFARFSFYATAPYVFGALALRMRTG